MQIHRALLRRLPFIVVSAISCTADSIPDQRQSAKYQPFLGVEPRQPEFQYRMATNNTPRSYGEESPLTEEFEALVHKLLAYYHVPAVSVAVVHGDKIWAEGYGEAIIGKQKATTDTLYYTGSTTKSFTTAAYSLLIEDTAKDAEPLTWTTRVSKITPDDFVLTDEYVTKHATFEDLASHRTGMPRHDDVWGGKDYSAKESTRAMRHLPLTAEFRSKFQYCNLMFMTLGHALETITKHPLAKTFTDRIWIPLGMDSTFLDLASLERAGKTNNLAQGYSWDRSEENHMKIPPGQEESYDQAAGAIMSTVADYAKYLQAMLKGAAPFPKAFHRQIRLPRISVDEEDDSDEEDEDENDDEAKDKDGEDADKKDEEEKDENKFDSNCYSLGWHLGHYRGEEWVGHGGRVDGFVTDMFFLPHKNWAMTVMLNDDENGYDVGQHISKFLVNEFLGLPRPKDDWAEKFEKEMKEYDEKRLKTKKRKFPNTPAVAVPHSLPIEAYTGTYEHPAYRRITFNVIKPSTRVPFENPDVGLVLHSKLPNDNVGLQYEHVSGEHFMAWVVAFDNPNGRAEGSLRVQFYVDETGVASRVGIEFESRMNGEKIWFDRLPPEKYQPIRENPPGMEYVEKKSVVVASNAS